MSSGTFSTSGQSITNVTAPLVNSGLPTRPNLSISAATTSAAGSMSAADKTKLDALGTILSATIAANVVVVAATNTVLQALTLTVGVWDVSGWCAVLNGAAAGQIDIWLDVNLLGPSTKAFAAAEQTTLHAVPVRVAVTSGTQVVNLRGYGNVGWTAIRLAGATGFAGGTGLRAVQIG